MQLIQKLRNDQKYMKKVEPSSRSKAIEDIISTESFMEALVLNHYVLVRKIFLFVKKLEVFNCTRCLGIIRSRQDESRRDHSWFDNAYSIIVSGNKTAKDLWDALERQMRGSEYGEQDRKARILYEYETFKAIQGEQLLDTYLRYLQVINDLKKCVWYTDEANQELMDINIDALYNILKQNQGDVDDAMGSKKKTVVVTSDPLALIAKKTNEGHFAKDYKKVKVKDYEYYKTKMLLAKKDKDEQVLLAEDQAWMESSSDSNQEINENMVFMAQIEKVLSDSE
nr:hypothetical protein [Tanacetum cinerariifolium]